MLGTLKAHPRLFYEFDLETHIPENHLVRGIDRVCVISERDIDPVHLERAKLFHAARHPNQEMDLFIRSELAGLTRPIAIRELLRQSSVGKAGWWSVVRAIRPGIVDVVNWEPITERSVICIPEGAGWQPPSLHATTSWKRIALSVSDRAGARSSRLARKVTLSPAKNGPTRNPGRSPIALISSCPMIALLPTIAMANSSSCPDRA
ncbi:hypothetical protein [Qingshengfaniella alkalisoli]|uniref:Uncharacterized protein n=1 Tax=Qingshengfaniella alkalisoli TaxID=2599296 RepID=A0A5B8IUY7_9RHOB|nr:hypothetical protein [Qingshengfaniella alkalisoli]QDY69414.1 hypothetical protein FPZ52_07105 [Qingshengfaniella alkalisoli]